MKKNNQLIVWLVLLGISLLNFTPLNAQAKDKQNIVIHLSVYNADLHAVSMALKIGTMILKKGEKVSMFLDLDGPSLADKRTPQNLRWGTGPEISKIFQKYLKAGGKVIVCPHCAMAKGINKSNLREGAEIGSEEIIGDLFILADKVIDYK